MLVQKQLLFLQSSHQSLGITGKCDEWPPTSERGISKPPLEGSRTPLSLLIGIPRCDDGVVRRSYRGGKPEGGEGSWSKRAVVENGGMRAPSPNAQSTGPSHELQSGVIE